MTHTPGPWVLKDDHLTPQVLVTGGTTRIVRFGPRENWDAVDYANARLIAAAPDMLDALEAFVEWASSSKTEYTDFRVVLEGARTAIAKGRPPKKES